MSPTTSRGPLVCVSGDFCSGSTLVYTLFRQTGAFRCLYEPLHEDMREFLVYGLRAEEHSHHFFVDQYHREFRGLRETARLFDRSFGLSRLSLRVDDEHPALERYMRYLVDASFERSPRVMFKENRLTFRLGWFRAKFPDARIVHIFRRKEAQWRSVVRRAQAGLKREDIGQDRPDFNGFGVNSWCEDLKSRFPELEASRFTSGFDRFAALWELSYRENRKYADVSVAYEDLIQDFVPTARRMFDGAAAPEVDVVALECFIVPPDRMSRTPPLSSLTERIKSGADRILRRYASTYARYRWPSR